MKEIVEIAKAQKVEAPKKNDVATLEAAQVGGTTPQEGARVLTKDAVAGADAGPGAATIVSAVSGEEILAAIVGAGADDPELAGSAPGVGTTSMSFARGGTSNTESRSVTTPKAAAVAGGIALRSLVKEGKLASHTGNDNKSVQSAGISAVNKLLVAVEDIIKKTVKKVIDKAKEKIDEARDSKETVKQ
ncbi:Variable large protein 7 [Borrelia sp. HM]|nr:Variable large protein 7 [Borrelia sp. HM]